MADASTRRSVRSRTQQPASSHHSSASSTSSHRAERGTRISAKLESPRKPTPSGSLSSEQADETVALTIEEGLQTRRSRKRGHIDEEDLPTLNNEEAMEEGEGEEDDGTVRCICGLAEYPGPPLWTEDDKKRFGDLEFITAEDVTDDLAGFFLSCDSCKVWQHGGCVGIKNEDVSPEEYYCEECRKDLHRVFIATDGQKYSLYLPLQPNFSPSTSRAASFSKDGASEKDRGGRATSAQQNAKRRSTMNSRDAAYDEEEQLRRAIAASKGEPIESVDGGVRRGKRGRSDSEEKPESAKRQRTASRSPSPAPANIRNDSQVDSDEDTKARNGTKRSRGAAAKNHSVKDAKVEREKMRLEAANKRKGRAERRRVDDDSEPPEEPPVIRPPTSVTSKGSEAPTSATTDPLPTSVPSQPDTPPAAINPPPSQANSQHKKSGAGGRPPGGRKGKSGKNQYTVNRDREHADADSPGRSRSRDRNSEHINQRSNLEEPVKNTSTSHRKKVNGHSNNKDSPAVVKISWLEMRRRVAAMIDYIAKVQVEMADQKQFLSGGSSSAGTPAEEEAAKGLMRGIAGSIVPMLKEQEEQSKVNGNGLISVDNVADKVWSEDMGLLDMMEFLTRRLVLWQRQFGA